MSNEQKQPPIRRLSCKIDGVKYDLGVVWAGKFGGKVNFNLTTDTTGKYPKIGLGDLSRRLEAGEKIFIDEYDNTPRGATQKPATGPSASDFDDVPFARFDQD
jgi:hypothetical protein